MAGKKLSAFIETKPAIPYDCAIVKHDPKSENSASMLDYLLSNPRLIRKEDNGRTFPDTEYIDLDGGGTARLIRYLLREGRSWTSKFTLLTSP